MFSAEQISHLFEVSRTIVQIPGILNGERTMNCGIIVGGSAVYLSKEDHGQCGAFWITYQSHYVEHFAARVYEQQNFVVIPVSYST